MKASNGPMVTFVVPCYKLAHFLAECVGSILSQDYEDFEILIMDDLSPDDTPSVAATFRDPRVRYVRNQVNFGHLRNYNRGIELARGRYLWLISADDRLRSKSALRSLVEPLERTPGSSFAFCPGVVIGPDGSERGTQGDAGREPHTYRRREFFRRGVQENFVCTPGTLTRTECYPAVGLFPTDLPYAGEWYLWLRFALMGPVVYVPEAGVDYRQHEGSNTAIYTALDAAIITNDEVEVRWRIRKHLEGAAESDLLPVCDEAIAWDYARRTYRATVEAWPFGLSPDAVRHSIGEHTKEPALTRGLWRQYAEAVGDLYSQVGDQMTARDWYRRAARETSLPSRATTKLALTYVGRGGPPDVRRGGPPLRRSISRCKMLVGRIAASVLGI